MFLPDFANKFLLTNAPALQSRNFRLFWFAQIISSIGTALQVVTEGWLIYQVTESTLWLGLVGFFGLLPVVPVALLGGVLIDRVPRRKLLLLTQTGLLLQAAVFAWLVLSVEVGPWHITGMYFVFGALLAIDHPARRAFLVELVPPDELANAVALNASLFNVSHLVGYAISGFLLAAIGAGGTMLLNALTYLAPVAALAAIRVADVGWDEKRPSLPTAVSEGFVTLWQKPAILGVICLMAVVGGLAWPVFGMMPAFAETIMGVGAVGLGLLLAAGALGSLLGTAVVSRLGRTIQGRSLTWASVLLPMMVMLVAAANRMVLALIFVMAVGVALIVLQSLAVTLVQVHITDRVRGRVMSLYSMVHAGADTMSNVVVGGTAVYLGLPVALVLAGGVALLFAVGLFLLMPAIRRLA